MTTICSVPGCDLPVLARGTCSTHYYRLRKGLPLDAPIGSLKRPINTCTVDGCDRRVVAHGLCDTHDARRRKGQPLDEPVGRWHREGTRMRSLMKFIEYSPDGCWLWTGALNKDGYGTGKPHRRAYELMVGPIPEGMTIDHKCHDAATCSGGPSCQHRRCCNPLHLEIETSADNAHRSAGERVLCRNGHDRAFTRISNGKRVCKICEKAAQERYLNRKRGIA
jgi:hypothetical protein